MGGADRLVRAGSYFAVGCDGLPDGSGVVAQLQSHAILRCHRLGGLKQLRVCAYLFSVLGSDRQLAHISGRITRHRVAGRAVQRHRASIDETQRSIFSGPVAIALDAFHGGRRLLLALAA